MIKIQLDSSIRNDTRTTNQRNHQLQNKINLYCVGGFIQYNKLQKVWKCSLRTSQRTIKRFKENNNLILRRSTGRSQPEQQIVLWLIEAGIPEKDIILNNRTVLKPKELDIFIPSLNLAIEYNGMLWHSSGTGYIARETQQIKYKGSFKTTECSKKGIRLVHINESQYLTSKNKVKRLIFWLVKTSSLLPKIFFDYSGWVLESSQKNTKFKKFMDKNNPYIQCSVRGEIRCLKIHNKVQAVLIGPKNKLIISLDCFINPNEIYKFFTETHNTMTGSIRICSDWYPKPDQPHLLTEPYCYVYKNLKNIKNLMYYKAHKLKELPNFCSSLTKEENLFNHGYRKIFDSGDYDLKLPPKLCQKN